MMLSAYADRMLTAQELSHVRAHLTACRRCREDLTEIESLKQLLRALPDPASSQNFWADTHRMLRQKASVSRHSGMSLPRVHMGWTAAMALGLVLAFVGSPQHLGHVSIPPQTVDLSALISLHAESAVRGPLADTGSARYALTEANTHDWTDDHTFDIQ